jgi:hypothetical protein
LLTLEIPVANPARWLNVAAELGRVLQFLTGDTWQLTFHEHPSLISPKRRVRRRLVIGSADCVSLFSGGLDSFVGVLDLLVEGHHPVLVSHAYPGDRAVQQQLLRGLPRPVPQLSANASPRMDGANETSMRSRSFLFIALGVAIAAQLAERRQTETTLFVPENAFIAVNPPLTPRRIGTLSTRTTHPHFLSSLQRVFQGLALGVRLENPYQHMTKGEMLRNCRDPNSLRNLAAATVSCGKWKRAWQQCGRCVPCVIRKASFASAGLRDTTSYGSSVSAALATERLRDDVLALGLAVRTLANESELRRAILATGPLESVGGDRDQIVASVRRGLRELQSFLSSEGLA